MTKTRDPEAAQAALLELLTQEGPLPAAVAVKRLEALGVSQGRAYRAKRALGLVGVDGVWSLPDDAPARCPTCHRPWGEPVAVEQPQPATLAPPEPPRPFWCGSCHVEHADGVTHCLLCGNPSMMPIGQPCMRAGCRGVYR